MPALIGVTTFGEVRPVAANDSLANRALERRAEIPVTPVRISRSETVEVSPATLEAADHLRARLHAQPLVQKRCPGYDIRTSEQERTSARRHGRRLHADVPFGVRGHG